MYSKSNYSEFASAIEGKLREVFVKRDSEVYNIMEFHLGLIDETNKPTSLPFVTIKRLHGVLTLNVAHVFGAPFEHSLDFAVSIEMLNSAFQIHEDIMHGNINRHGERSSVWWRWGPAQAINVGDGMHSLARLNLCNLNIPVDCMSRAVSVFDESVLARCEAEYIDIKYQERFMLSVDDYIAFTQKRAGAFFSAGAVLGILANNTIEPTEDQLNSLRNFGSKIGALMQIQEDIRTIWGENTQSNTTAYGRATNKKVSLPLVVTLNKALPRAKVKVSQIYTARMLSPDALKEFANLAEETGSKKVCEDIVRSIKKDAFASLHNVGLNNQQIEELQNIAELILE